ncbi:transferase hexapeptide repeat containing protein [Methanococcus aeolicus Nankai-3]|uniref:Transferase hexapeptide repeat containing protein n=1 Tax=Methanococcus aeolicus (strain ATCC BAA-1280 / DSM 17508 / OCM 812 / Nankai-3) TaxID=419665 RepID=A6UUM5_META3|nr:gamma carbonic anhydrase family protein [Methanococcus aeolicus]ABR56197.1 transferase hexapeptide repeat containing protein [Methanococcus aeolicus Nankai-3]
MNNNINNEYSSSVQIAKNATVLGGVILEDYVNVWYGAVIRADVDKITIKKGSNIQDNCVIHCSKGYPTEIGEYVSVGHGAVVHGCKIGNNVIVGMNATILNGAKIGNNCIIGANTLITQHKEIPDNSLVVGAPGNAIRTITEDEILDIKDNALRYIELSKNMQ